MTDRILVVDDDPDIRLFLEIALETAGFEVVLAQDGEDALQRIFGDQPDLVLLDVMMPQVDGLEVVRRVRADGRTEHIPVILVSARAAGDDKVEGLGLGADDYVTKPFSPDELVARIRATLRRSREMRSLSPLTGLPGNVRIELVVQARIDAGDTFALLYADLNRFKGYNDHYGFMRGDDVIRGLADVLKVAAAERGGPDAFVGHVGGDDFAVVVDAERAEAVAELVCQSFDELAPSFYDADDREAGFIETTDRQGQAVRHPVVSVSIGIAHNGLRELRLAGEVVSIATEMKSFAKRTAGDGSNWAVDRRTEG